jgi:hypothetical protein
MADVNFIVEDGLKIGSTTISSSSGSITVGNTTIDGSSGNITVGNTTINAVTGDIHTTSNITTVGTLTIGSNVITSGSNYSLPAATTSTLGGVIISTGLAVDGNGHVSISSVSASSVTGLANVATSGSYVDLTNKPTIPSAYTLPVATASVLGGVKQGLNITIGGDGTINAVSAVTSVAGRTGNITLTTSDIGGLANVASSGSYVDLTNKPTIPSAYTLPVATASVLGGVKQGGNVAIDGNGVISANVTVTSVFGRQGDVTLQSTDVVTALGYTPVNTVAGRTGNVTLSASDISGLSSSSTPTFAGVTMNGLETITFDGDQQLMGNADVSKFHVGGVAAASGTISTLLGSSDFAHYYLAHNFSQNASGTISAPDDASAASYIHVWSDAGTQSIYQAPAGGSVVLNSTPTYKLNMLTGDLSINGNFTAAGDINSASDQALKTNINTITSALDTVCQMRGVSFDWVKTGNMSYGVIAQEVEALIPEIVTLTDAGIKTVNYNAIIGFLIESVKDLQQQINDLKSAS